MNTLRRSTLRAALAATALCVALAWSADAPAQAAWPSKPVRVVVPFAPGGATDVVGRMLAQKLAEVWGQSVVVENRTGAGGSVGARHRRQVCPATATRCCSPRAPSPSTRRSTRTCPSTPQKDLVPITNVASGPMLVVVPDDSPARSVKDLIAMAKAKPGTVNFGSAGVGSQTHLAAENFADAAGIDIVHVPYKGEAPAYTDLIGRQTQMMVGNFAAASALLGPGRLRALAVTGKARSPLLPDVPTVAESGLPASRMRGWFGLFAPAGTPPEILAKIQRDTLKVLAATDFKARLYVQGMAPVGNTPAEFAKAMDEESRHWAAVVEEPQAQRELRRPDRHEDRSPGHRGRGEGALHPRPEDAAARHQERLRPLAAIAKPAARRGRCSPPWSPTSASPSRPTTCSARTPACRSTTSGSAAASRSTGMR